jgi:hypothetical protein
MEEEHKLKDLKVKNRAEVEFTQTSMEQSSLWVSNLAVTYRHTCYCGLVRGRHVEEEQ